MSMKASELRIGNYVYSSGLDHKNVIRPDQIHIVESILGSTSTVFLHSLDREILKKVKLKHVDPIPLTEKWLIKFGFELQWDDPEGQESNYIKPFPGGSIAVYTKGEDKGTYIAGVWGAYTDYGIKVNCECVHTLQNLYFALTGDELTIQA